MTERELIPRLPTSGQILGTLVSKLGIKHPALQSRTARRYFSADLDHLVKDSTREKIIGAIAEVLTDSGFITPSVREDNQELGPTLASMLQWHADHWDLIRSFLRRRTMPVLPRNLPMVWETYVRLAVVDLALRVAAHLHLAGSSPAALDLLISTNRNARGFYLNQMRQQAGFILEELAEKIEVDDHTVDAWMYQGVRPSNDNLTKVAKALADSIEGSNASDVALELRVLYWISDVADLLAEHISAEAVEEAIERLRRYTEATYHIIEDWLPAEDRIAEITALADLGSGARLAVPLLEALIEQEPDDDWREDLRPFGIDWMRRILSANLSAHLSSVDYLSEKTKSHSTEDGDTGNTEADSHYRRSLELEMQGRSHEALDEMETAARLDPLNPKYHCSLGLMKAGGAIWTGRTPLVDEGLNALWIAVALEPSWIIPWTEIGVTLHYTDRSEEAVEHLRNVSPDRGPLDSNYYSALGAACWKVGDMAEALSAFEASLNLDPEETSDLLAASEIALLTGDNEKHRRYLRRAKHFGAEEETLKLWEWLRKFGEED